MRKQSMINQQRRWIMKKNKGSQWNKKTTDQEDTKPKIMHSEKGSSRIVIGIIAARNLVHLKTHKKLSALLYLQAWADDFQSYWSYHKNKHRFGFLNENCFRLTSNHMKSKDCLIMTRAYSRWDCFSRTPFFLTNVD